MILADQYHATFHSRKQDIRDDYINVLEATNRLQLATLRLARETLMQCRYESSKCQRDSDALIEAIDKLLA